MSKNSEVFDRWELKYLMDVRSIPNLLEYLSPLLIADENGDSGSYKIRSLYYDTRDFKYYFEKIDGEKIRSKPRIRSYNQITENDTVFFELKRRINQATQKSRVLMNLQDAYDLINKGQISIDTRKFNGEELQVISTLDLLALKNSIEPKCIVSYDRKAYMGKYERGLRITFDTNLRCRKYNLKLEEINRELFFIKPQYCVLEIKSNRTVPKWVVSAVQTFSIESLRISKYCLSIDRLYKLRGV